MRRINVDQFVDVSPDKVLGEFYLGEPEFELLGIPTLLLRPEDYNTRNYADVQKEIETRAASFTTRVAPGDSYDAKQIESLARSLHGAQPSVSTVAAWPLCRDPKFAFYYSPAVYRQPAASIITAPAEGNYTDRYDAMMAGIIHKDRHASFPGTPQERTVFALLHEGPHGAGAAEKASEKIAAIIHKRAFNNNAYLKRESDVRAVRNIFETGIGVMHAGGIIDMAKTYSWSMCEVLDEVIATPRDQLLALDEAQMKEMRFDNANPNYIAANNVGFILSFQNREYHTIRSMLERQMERGQLTNEDNRRVGERFLLAWERLNIGGHAYTNTPDPYDIAPGAKLEKLRLPWVGHKLIEDIFSGWRFDRT